MNPLFIRHPEIISRGFTVFPSETYTPLIVVPTLEVRLSVELINAYLYSEISDDLKKLEDDKYEQKIEYVGEETISLLKCDMDKMQSEVICKFKEKGKFDKFLIFAKTSAKMNAEDRFLIESATYVIRKYL